MASAKPVKVSSGQLSLFSASDTVPVNNLPVMVGDSGAGGTAGLVPAPSAGDAAASKFLKADATWASVAAPGGGSVSTAEIDFGSTPVWEKSFIITDAGVTSGMKIVVSQSYAAATGKDQDENEMDSFDFRAEAGTGQFTLYVTSHDGMVADKFKINYIAGA